MNPPLNVRIIPTLYADLPTSFEERIDGRMSYHLEGDNVYVTRAELMDTDMAFRETTIFAELKALFDAFPNQPDAVLSPR